MPDATELMNTVKRAAVAAVEASKPVGVCFGTVISISPMKIRIDPKLELGKKQLVLTRSVTDYTVEMTVDHMTEDATVLNTVHDHAYTGTKSFLVRNSLKVGEEVALLRMQGGQKYLVLDRVVNI